MKRLLVTLVVELPDEATQEDADVLAAYMAELATAPTEGAAFGNFPQRPVGKLSDWLFEG